MNWHIKQLLFFFALNLFICAPLCADSLNLETSDSISTFQTNNTLDTALIKELSEQPRFQYQKEFLQESKLAKLWNDIKSYILQKIGQLLHQLFGVRVSKTTSAVIFWILLLFFIAVIAYLLFRTKKQLFTSSGAIPDDASDIEIENISYFEKIERAKQNEEYKSGIRYILLHTIQQLSEDDTIKYIPGKTLFEYQYDIKNQDFRKLFMDICYIYEYIWFGNFHATKAIFDEMFQTMNLLLTTQNSRR